MHHAELGVEKLQYHTQISERRPYAVFDLLFHLSRHKNLTFQDIRKNVPRYIVGGGGPPKKLVPYTDSEPEGAGGESSGGGKSPPSAGSAEKKERSGSSDSEDISHLPDELQDLIRRSNAVIKNSETSGEDEEEDVQEVAVEMKAPTALADYDCGDEEDDSESWSPDMEKRFKEFKSDYYMNKLRFDHVTPYVLFAAF